MSNCDCHEHENPLPENEFVMQAKGGNPSHTAQIEEVSSKSALEVAYRITTYMCGLLVGHDRGPQLKYYLAGQLLASLNGWDEEEFMEMVDKANEDPKALYGDWNPWDDSGE